jgi:uncharacterized protein (TIGR03118 family)
VSTLYDGNGVPSPTVPAPLIVTIPPASGNAADTGSPTGIVFNASNDFQVPPGAATTGAARFIFVSEDGMISGWAPNIDPTHAIKGTVANAVYKGVTVAGNGSDHFRLYAADFIGKKVDVYDENFNPIPMPGAFVDPTVPSDYGPFNIMNIQGNLCVAYAKHSRVATMKRTDGIWFCQCVRCRWQPAAASGGRKVQCALGHGARTAGIRKFQQ